MLAAEPPADHRSCQLWSFATAVKVIAGVAALCCRGVSGLVCYDCSSSINESCKQTPQTTATCGEANSRGCSTTYGANSVSSRRCAAWGALPDGCEMESGKATRCICNHSRCNSIAAVPVIKKQNVTFWCYSCSSRSSPKGCGQELANPAAITRVSCPAVGGCFLTMIEGAGGAQWIRECPWIESAFAATYFPSGCYTVWRRNTNMTLCVCRSDGCNLNMSTVMDSAVLERIRNEQSDTQVSNATSPKAALFLVASFALLVRLVTAFVDVLCK